MKSDEQQKSLEIFFSIFFQVKCRVAGDAYVVVYSITDRNSFQNAVQLIKNIRERESAVKRHVPIILVGNKSDLVRKRVVNKEG